MKNSQTKKRILAVALMVIGVMLFILIGQRYYFRQVDCHQIRLEGLYMEDKDSLDVIVVGSSEVYNGYMAAEAYRLYGFTSYPFAFATNPCPLLKYEMAELEKMQHPKVLVIEVNGFCYDRETLYRYAAIRHFADSIPMSGNKIDLVNDLATESKLSYYMPFFKYHDDWRKNPFNLIIPELRGYNILRGAYTHAQNVKIKEEEIRPPDGKRGALISDAKEDLEEFLDYCDQSDIENVVFVRFPHVILNDRSERMYHRFNVVSDIVRERGYEYIDFDDYHDEIGLDPLHDFYDGEHLNAYGAEKFTNYFGKWLVDKYGLTPTELTDKQKAEWDESADYIQRFFKYHDENIQKNGFYEPSKKEAKEMKAKGKKIIKEIHETLRTMKVLNSMD